MTVLRDLMTPNPVTVSTNTSIPDAARLMKQHDIGSLPVVDGDEVVGLVTDRDLVLKALAEGVADADVGAIMSKNVVSASPDSDESEAQQLMAEHGIRRLPICEGRRLVGIVSVGDLAVRVSEQAAGEVMEQTGPTD